MWTATLERADRENGRLYVEIMYLDQDTGESIPKLYVLDRATRKSLRNLARLEVSKLDDLKNEVINLPVGATIDIDPDPVIPPPVPTAEEIARSAWFADWSKLGQFLRLANAGLMQMTDTKITNLQASLTTDWLNSYLDGV